MSEVWQNFYVVEGIDGAGKSTAMELLKKRAKREGADNVVFTAEPTKYGRAILEAMQSDGAPHPDTFSYLFAADRNEHLYGKDGIDACLDAGLSVFCDRYFFSSLVYQGIAGSGETAKRLNEGFPLPEALFFLDIKAEDAMRRIAARGGADGFERLDFLKRAEAEYRRMIACLEREPSSMRVMRISAYLPPEEIAGIIWREAWQ